MINFSIVKGVVKYTLLVFTGGTQGKPNKCEVNI